MLIEVCFSRTTDFANSSEVWFDSWVNSFLPKITTAEFVCSDLVGLLHGSRVIHHMDWGVTPSYTYVIIYIYDYIYTRTCMDCTEVCCLVS